MTSPLPPYRRGAIKDIFFKKNKGFKASKSLSFQERDLERGHILFIQLILNQYCDRIRRFIIYP
jgi:hypothetical protein